VTDLGDWPAFDTAYAQWLGATGLPAPWPASPTSTTEPRSRSTPLRPSARAVADAADITVLAAGGTIDKCINLAGQLEIGPPAAHRLLEVLKTDLGIEVRSVVAKDSLDITDADRQLLLEDVDNAESASVVITHRTDTLTQTAQYLSRYASTSTAKVVVLTGRDCGSLRRFGCFG
jgi:L-asparaginase/Glu-tRNA(Gln) amidotransferase subunit D